jgi:hypothetical protein
MAKLNQGILGGITGKIGNVIGSSWKGIPVIKSKPLSVANPKTAGQVAQRSKFSNCVAFASAILSTIIKPLWDRFASQESGYNAFCSVNVALFANEMPSTPSSLVISRGKMAVTAVANAEMQESSGEITVSWVNDAGEGLKLAEDIPYFLIVNETKEKLFAYNGIAEGKKRSSTSVTVDTGIIAGVADDIHCYLAFKRVDGTVVSGTAYSVVAVSPV